MGYPSAITLSPLVALVRSLDAWWVKRNTVELLIRRRAISQLLVVAALLAAMGGDALAQTGIAVRAEAVVNVAERMASKFSHAFARKVHQPAIRFQESRPAAAALAQRTPAAVNLMPVHTIRQSERLLYLPPPVLG